MTSVANNDGLGEIIFRGSDGNSFEDGAAIRAFVDGTPGDSDMPGRLSFHTSADGDNTLHERVRIDALGKLLVGTTSSSYKFHVDAASLAAEISIDNDASNYIVALNTTNSANADFNIQHKQNLTSIGTGVNIPLCFHINGSTNANSAEKMRLSTGGNFGIGTNNPQTRLELTDNTSNNYGTTLRFSQGYNSVFSEISSNFGGSMTLNAGQGTTSAIMHFQVNDDEKMRITNNGKLGVNTTSPDGSWRTTILEDSSGHGVLVLDRTSNIDGTFRSFVSIRRSGTVVGSIKVNNSATQYNTSSDHRLKENVVTMSNATDRLKQLQPKRFNFILNPDTTVDGFLAHEVQSVVPEAISGTKDEVDSDNNPVYQGIDQSKLVPLLTAALQEAITKIETLETKVAALEGS